MKLVLPLPPNRGNARWHWRKEKRLKHEYYDLALAWDQNLNPPRPPKPLQRARISATLYVWSTMDGDNLMARLKWTLDFLVLRGWIADDSPAVLEWVAMPTQHVDRRETRVELELEGA